MADEDLPIGVEPVPDEEGVYEKRTDLDDGLTLIEVWRGGTFLQHRHERTNPDE